eukprot:4612204-Amphidinium_carterae.2
MALVVRAALAQEKLEVLQHAIVRGLCVGAQTRHARLRNRTESHPSWRTWAHGWLRLCHLGRVSKDGKDAIALLGRPSAVHGVVTCWPIFIMREGSDGLLQPSFAQELHGSSLMDETCMWMDAAKDMLMIYQVEGR